MIKLDVIEYFKCWNNWRKHNANSKLHKLLVLLKLTHSPTFELFHAGRGLITEDIIFKEEKE